MDKALNPNIMMVVRYGLMTLGGYLAGKGLVPADAVGSLVEQALGAFGAVLALVTFLWGLYTNRRDARIEQTAALPGVAAVVTDDKATAQAIPVPNVVSTAEVVARGLDAALRR